MPSAPADLETAEELVSDRTSLRETVERSLLEGLAVLLPLLVTLLVVSFVLGFLFQHLSPIVVTVTSATGFRSELLVGGLTVGLFLLTVFAVGFVHTFVTDEDRISRQFHRFMESIPAIGSVYTSFNQMSSLLLDSDTDSFQDVKLVEYPTEGSYAVAFKTAETPEVITDDTGTPDMVTLFMPMAPNPVMGGFVIHVDRTRVVDVDLTVEEGIRSIVTSGVAIGDQGAPIEGLSEAQMRQLGSADAPATYAPVDTPATRSADPSAGAASRDDDG